MMSLSSPWTGLLCLFFAYVVFFSEVDLAPASARRAPALAPQATKLVDAKDLRAWSPGAEKEMPLEEASAAHHAFTICALASEDGVRSHWGRAIQSWRDAGASQIVWVTAGGDDEAPNENGVTPAKGTTKLPGMLEACFKAATSEMVVFVRPTALLLPLFGRGLKTLLKHFPDAELAVTGRALPVAGAAEASSTSIESRRYVGSATTLDFLALRRSMLAAQLSEVPPLEVVDSSWRHFLVQHYASSWPLVRGGNVLFSLRPRLQAPSPSLEVLKENIRLQHQFSSSSSTSHCSLLECAKWMAFRRKDQMVVRAMTGADEAAKEEANVFKS